MITLKIKDIEVIQSVQKLGRHESRIPLLQDKLSYIRYYLTSDCANLILINARLRIFAQQNGSWCHVKTLPCLQTLPVFNDENVNVHQLRKDWKKSLNFKLPHNFFSDESLSSNDSVRLKFELCDIDTKNLNEETQCKDDSSTEHTVVNEFVFHEQIVLNVRAVAYRYEDRETGLIYEPSEGEIRVIQEYVQNVFPVSKLNWSYVTVDAPRGFHQLRRVLNRSERSDERIDKVYTFLFQHLLALRNQDISFDPSPRPEDGVRRDSFWPDNTLYLGILSDPHNQIIGSAMDSPAFPTPHVVAFSGTEPYGEIGAHELGHMLGRLHPGIPHKKVHGKIIGQKRQLVDADYEQNHELGFISKGTNEVQSPEEILLGLDAQFEMSHPKVLQYNEYYDLMTYRYPKWISEFTYNGLLCRLSQIQSDSLKKESEEKFYWNVIGEYNLITKTAKINYVLASSFDVNKLPEGTYIQCDQTGEVLPNIQDEFKLTLQYREFVPPPDDPDNDETPGETELSDPQEIYLRRNLLHSDNSSFVGVFQHTICTSNRYRPPQEITLSLNYNPIDIYDPGNRDNPTDAIVELLLKLITFLNISPMPWQKVLPQLEAVPSGETESNSHDQTQGENREKDRIYLEYSVDDNAFFLSFNWLVLKDPERDCLSKFEEFLIEVKLLNIPVVTTIQFKSNLENEISGEVEKWQTVYVSKRLKEKIWISPDFSVALSSDKLSNKIFPPYPKTVNKISRINGAPYFEDLGIRFRVCISFAGFDFILYDSGEHTRYEEWTKGNTIKIEAFGSKGSEGINFYRPHNAETRKPEIYYRPSQ